LPKANISAIKLITNSRIQIKHLMEGFRHRVKAIQEKLRFWNDHNNLIFIAAFAFIAIILTAALSIFNFAFDLNKTYIIISESFIFFICFIVIQITLDIRVIKTKVENNYTCRTFRSGVEFDDYLQDRTNSAKQVRIIHFSSTVSNLERKYVKIIDEFVEVKKGVFQRIIADSTKEVYNWNFTELVHHKDSSYHVFLIDKIKIPVNMRTMGVMIIDDDEVCLGGGYQNFFVNPTISIKNHEITKFYKDYYEYLLTFSIPTRYPDHKLDNSLFIKAGIAVEKILKMDKEELQQYRNSQFKSID
jgi:hypothetical protein